MRVDFCESCGAPLEARWDKLVIRCRYCASESAPGGPGSPVPLRVPVDERPRLSVAGRTYVLERCVGHGDACEVYRGRWVVRLGELVLVKVLRSLDDADLLRREWSMLESLVERPTQGAEHFTSLLPRPVAMAPVHLDGTERLVAVYQWRSGFVHDLEAVGRVHAQGVDGRIVVWVLKRLLELLGWVHAAGVVHGAVLPPHVLVHPRDHGATLAGWSAATSIRSERQPVPARSRVWRKLYPEAVWEGGPVSPATDVAMAARCALVLARGGLPGVLGRMVSLAAEGGRDDAWALVEELSAASRAEYGPPRYSPLPMPGWSLQAEES